MSDLAAALAAIKRMDKTNAQLERTLNEVSKRLGIAIVAGVIVASLALVSVLAIGLLIRGNSADIDAQNKVICPAVKILASTDPPRTTPAGQKQAEDAQRVLRGPAFEACR